CDSDDGYPASADDPKAFDSVQRVPLMMRELSVAVCREKGADTRRADVSLPRLPALPLII
ncbi:hypothetical protein, partial [Microbacterium petrolearium]